MEIVEDGNTNVDDTKNQLLTEDRAPSTKAKLRGKSLRKPRCQSANPQRRVYSSFNLLESPTTSFPELYYEPTGDSNSKPKQNAKLCESNGNASSGKKGKRVRRKDKVTTPKRSQSLYNQAKPPMAPPVTRGSNLKPATKPRSKPPASRPPERFPKAKSVCSMPQLYNKPAGAGQRLPTNKTTPSTRRPGNSSVPRTLPSLTKVQGESKTRRNFAAPKPPTTTGLSKTKRPAPPDSTRSKPVARTRSGGKRVKTPKTSTEAEGNSKHTLDTPKDIVGREDTRPTDIVEEVDVSNSDIPKSTKDSTPREGLDKLEDNKDTSEDTTDTQKEFGDIPKEPIALKSCDSWPRSAVLKRANKFSTPPVNTLNAKVRSCINLSILPNSPACIIRKKLQTSLLPESSDESDEEDNDDNKNVHSDEEESIKSEFIKTETSFPLARSKMDLFDTEIEDSGHNVSQYPTECPSEMKPKQPVSHEACNKKPPIYREKPKAIGKKTHKETDSTRMVTSPRAAKHGFKSGYNTFAQSPRKPKWDDSYRSPRDVMWKSSPSDSALPQLRKYEGFPFYSEDKTHLKINRYQDVAKVYEESNEKIETVAFSSKVKKGKIVTATKSHSKQRIPPRPFRSNTELEKQQSQNSRAPKTAVLRLDFLRDLLDAADLSDEATSQRSKKSTREAVKLSPRRPDYGKLKKNSPKKDYVRNEISSWPISGTLGQKKLTPGGTAKNIAVSASDPLVKPLENRKIQAGQISQEPKYSRSAISIKEHERANKQLERAKFVHLMIDQLVCAYKKIPLPKASDQTLKRLQGTRASASTSLLPLRSPRNNGPKQCRQSSRQPSRQVNNYMSRKLPSVTCYSTAKPRITQETKLKSGSTSSLLKARVAYYNPKLKAESTSNLLRPKLSPEVKMKADSTSNLLKPKLSPKVKMKADSTSNLLKPGVAYNPKLKADSSSNLLKATVAYNPKLKAGSTSNLLGPKLSPEAKLKAGSTSNLLKATVAYNPKLKADSTSNLLRPRLLSEAKLKSGTTSNLLKPRMSQEAKLKPDNIKGKLQTARSSTLSGKTKPAKKSKMSDARKEEKALHSQPKQVVKLDQSYHLPDNYTSTIVYIPKDVEEAPESDSSFAERFSTSEFKQAAHTINKCFKEVSDQLDKYRGNGRVTESQAEDRNDLDKIKKAACDDIRSKLKLLEADV